MKKIMFLAIFATAFSFSAFSQREITINPGEQAIVKTTPCPSNPIVVTNPDPVKLTQPVWKPLTPPKREDRIIYLKDKPSVSNTNSNNVNIYANQNHYHYPEPSANKNSSNWWYVHDNGLLALLLILLLIGAIIYLLNKKASTTSSPVTVHVPPAPPAPSPVVVVPPSLDEVDKAMDKAASKGGTFTRSMMEVI